jgi:hypothetical protein
MKNSSRKGSTRKTTDPTLDQLQQYIQCMADEHQQTWRAELMSSAPYWVYLLGLHLRLVELDHLENAVEELL